MNAGMTIIIVVSIICGTLLIASILFEIALRIVTNKEDNLKKYKAAQCSEAHKDGSACKPYQVAQGEYECVFRNS